MPSPDPQDAQDPQDPFATPLGEPSLAGFAENLPSNFQKMTRKSDRDFDILAKSIASAGITENPQDALPSNLTEPLASTSGNSIFALKKALNLKMKL